MNVMKWNSSLIAVAAALTAAVLPLAASAREISSLVVDPSTTAASVAFEAGTPGDAHVLYYAWSLDGLDKGGDPGDWPNVLRMGRVADNATSFTFPLPPAAAPSGLYVARAFLTTSSLPYDHLVQGVASDGSLQCYVNTNYKPKGGETSIAVDFSVAELDNQYFFGTQHSGSFTFCGYIAGTSKKWSYACNDGAGDWKNANLEATAGRAVMTLDSTVVEDGVPKSRFSITTSSESKVAESTEARTKLANYTLTLFGRHSSASAIDRGCAATIHSCSMTNLGVCVRDFVPCVSNGVAGLYDKINGNIYFSAGTTPLEAVGENESYGVAAGDVFVAASPAWTLSSSDFVTMSPLVVSRSLTSATGGTKRGAAPLTLSGANDWGGMFTVYEGTLVADFGQGLAATDSLVLNGGAYCPLASSAFTASFGSGGGAVSVVPLADGGTGAGFSAYGHPLSVTLGGSAATPFMVGPSSNPLFDVPLILNDAWATDELVLNNGIVGDGTTPVLTNITDGAAAFVRGPVSGISLVKTGSGTLVLNGLNSLSNLHGLAGSLVLAPNGGSSSETTVSGAFYGYGGGVVCSNSTLTIAANSFVRAGGSLTLVDDSVLNVGNIRFGYTSAGRGDFIVDGSTVTSSGALLVGAASSTYDNAGNVIFTNGSNVTFADLTNRCGFIRQYGGSVKFTRAFHSGTSWSVTNLYELNSGEFESSSTGNSAFRMGVAGTDGAPYAIFRVNGGRAVIRSRYPSFGYGKGGNANNKSGNRGRLEVYGGEVEFLRSAADAQLRIGNQDYGYMIVTNGSVNVQGSILACYAPCRDSRTSQIDLFKDAVVRTRQIRAVTNLSETATTLVMDGATLIAQANAYVNFVSNFCVAAVGVNGAIVDTEGQNIAIAQGFSAREGQTWPLDGIESPSGDDLAAAAAFTKAGEGVLTLTGSNTWACATCVSNGTLAANGEFSLPETTTLQLCEGAVLDLCGRTHTVANLVGSGVVSNGALVVTGAVWPGHRGGVLEFKGATLAARKLSYAFGAEGICGCLVMDGAFDLTGVEITADNLVAKPTGGIVIIRAASINGTPTSALTGANALSVFPTVVRIGLSGMRILIR